MSVIFLISYKLNNYQKSNLFGINNLFKALLIPFQGVGFTFANKSHNSGGMMKKIFILLMIALTVSAFAKTEKINVNSDTITLSFENVKLKTLKFYKGNQIKFSNEKDAEVVHELVDDNIIFSSENPVRIKLWLPKAKMYILQDDDNTCEFKEEYVKITTEDETIVEFKDKEMTITEKDGNEIVRIGSEGIYINDDDEFVEISSRGIIVESDNENKHLTGFWGQILGGFVTFVTKASISLANKHPEVIAKQIINDEDDTGEIISGYSVVDVGYSNKDKSEKSELTFDAEKDMKVHIKNLNGKVIVNSWDKDYINIAVTKRSRKGSDEFKKVKVEVSGKNGCTIETFHLEKNPKVSVEFEIKLPEFVRLSDVTSSNGLVRITDVKGDAELETSNGNIEVFDHIGNIDADTGNGRVELVNVKGKVTANTNNGKIRLYKTSSIVSATTSNGKIEAQISELENDTEIRTSNGSVTLDISPDLNADIKARTSNSKIVLNNLEVITDSFSNDSLEGRLGSGGKKINIRTSNGKIILNNLHKATL